MKKSLSMITTLLLVAGMLAACGSEETTTFEQEKDGAQMTMDVTHDDEVSEIKQTSTLNYEEIGADKDQVKEAMEKQMESIKDKDGVDIDADYGDEELEQTVTITIADVDMDELQEIVGDSGDKDGDYVDFDKVKDSLEDQGFEEKE